MSSSNIFWFTGLSGSGKTTVAEGAANLLNKEGISVHILDGDEVRKNLHMHLGFSREDILKNNSLIMDLCEQYRRKFSVILVPIISPFSSSRKEAKARFGGSFFEVYCSANLKTVVARDTKGLYQKAAKNEITNLIGFSANSPYETPTNPDFIVDSEHQSVEESIKEFYSFVQQCLARQSISEKVGSCE